MAERNFLVRADGEWVRNSLGRLVKFTEEGAHRWASRKKPAAYSVIRQVRSPREHTSKGDLQ